MYLGWTGFESSELTNTLRASAYAKWAGITWLSNCSECEAFDDLFPRGLTGGPVPTATGEYVSPAQDPAPWYTPSNPDSKDFLGCVLLDISGVDDSVRQITMTSSITGGASGGKTYFSAREMVLRILLVAADECALQYGLDWLGRTRASDSICGGGRFKFYECCPCLDDDVELPPPVTRRTWDKAEGTWDAQTETWDPQLNQIDMVPGSIDEYQFMTIDSGALYNPAGVNGCVSPYLRIMQNVRITSGPSVIERIFPACGAGAIVEMTVTAGDPAVYGLAIQVAQSVLPPGVAISDPPREMPKAADPFMPDRTPVRVGRDIRETIPDRWSRATIPISLDVLNGYDGPVVPEITLVAEDDVTSPVRVGVVSDRYEVGSWIVRRMPKGATVTLSPHTSGATVKYRGSEDVRHDVLLGGDGGPPWPMLPLESRRGMRLVVDRSDDSRVSVRVAASTIWRQT